MIKLGIALGGGGAKGIAHIGVLRVLEQAQLPIHAIAGTSAGSLVGALYAAGKSSDALEQMIRRTDLRHWLARDKTGLGIFSPEGFRRIIENEIGATTRIEDLRIKYAAVAVEMESQQETVFDAGLVTDAVCASCAFPVLLAPAQIQGRHYLDGGLLNPVPFDVVRRLGAECVLAVDLVADEPVFTAHPALHKRAAVLFRLIFSAEQQAILRVGARAIGIMTQPARKLKLQQAPPDLIVYPDVRQIGLIDIDLVDVSLEAGERAMRSALPELYRLLQPTWWQRVQKRWQWK